MSPRTGVLICLQFFPSLRREGRNAQGSFLYVYKLHKIKSKNNWIITGLFNMEVLTKGNNFKVCKLKFNNFLAS